MKRQNALAALLAALCLTATACGGTPEASAADTAAQNEDAAVQTDADLSAYAGCWKYDTLPFYMVLNEDGEWIAVNVYGSQVGPGLYHPDGDGVTLVMDDGETLTSFTPTDSGLTDAAGNTLTAWDYIMLLPTAEDELNMTASFPDDFANVTIQYPVQMNANPIPGIPNALAFNAEMESGTEDYYSNIFIGFEPISGYDDKMTQGLAAAKPYMEQMLNEQLAAMYAGKILKTVAADCIDAGNYYSITGYVWLDPSVFDDSPSEPVRGIIEVRYYGPTGYSLVSMAVSLDSRIENYNTIRSNMLATCSYTTDWLTAPKPVPTAAPAAQAASTNTANTGSAAVRSGSDSGDYGTPYYWNDEDGDIWYWNGSSNEFIGYGSDYYIDDDGQYYESNDAGWEDDGVGDTFDYEEEYYEDYDPWSDPGDTWGDYEDYSYDDEGWGDYFE